MSLPERLNYSLKTIVPDIIIEQYKINGLKIRNPNNTDKIVTHHYPHEVWLYEDMKNKLEKSRKISGITDCLSNI